MFLKKFTIHLFVMLLFISIVLSSLTIGISATENSEPTTLDSVEIREYEGEDLSSIDNFFENSIKGPQYVDIENYTLKITGLVNNQLELTYDEVISNYTNVKKIVTLYCVEGWNVTILWEGIQVKDIIEDAEVDPKANTVIFYAQDGYSTALPLDYITNNNILIAYKMNNITLPPERGYPFELVAESKWGYKWIKWITTIELSENENYMGYWESRGYSNDANLGEIAYNPQMPTQPPITPPPEVPELSWTIIPLVVAAIIIEVIYRKKLTRMR